MKKGLVTVLIPSYNLSRYIPRLLDSILYQTYPDIEIYIINDGSTDNTVEVVSSYIEKYNNKGYNLHIISQKNKGQSYAINNGLKYVDGEFLVWPDSDDWFASPYSIEKLVHALINGGPYVGVSRCAYQQIDEVSFKCIKVLYPSHDDIPTNIFDEAVKAEPGFWLNPGGWMVKVEFLDRFIPNRNIYTSRLTGQNSQILWPYLYHTKCVSIPEPLFCCMVRKNSHSRGQIADYENKKQQQIEYGETFHHVLDSIEGMNEGDRQAYHQIIDERINAQLLSVARKYNKSKDIREYLRKKIIHHQFINLRLTDFIVYPLTYIPCGVKMCSIMIKRISTLSKMIWKNKLITILLLLLFALIFMMLSPKILRIYYEKSFSPVQFNNVADFEKKLLEGSLRMLGDEYSTDESIIYYRTIPEFIHRCINRGNVSVYEYGEYGYFLYYTYLYALSSNNISLMNTIKNKFDNGFLFDNKEIKRICRNDQIPYGLISVLLDKMYANGSENSPYRRFCDALYQRLDSMDKADGIVLYHEYDKRQHADGIGLVCPFLALYGNTYKSERSIEMALKMIDGYLKYGVDQTNGLPAQAYNTDLNIKDLRPNWGRGTAWFFLGVESVDSFIKTDKQLINKADSTLYNLSPLFQQYFGEESVYMPDMSATIPLNYYLFRKSIRKMPKADFCKIISPYTDSNGIIRFNSPTIGRPDEKPNAFQSHHLTQGLALYMFSILE